MDSQAQKADPGVPADSPRPESAFPLFKRADSKARAENLSLGKLYEILRRNLLLFLCIFFVGSVAVSVIHVLLPSYRTGATIVLQAAINNPLQSLSSRLGGFSGFDVDGREVDRYLARLRVFSFYHRLAADLQESADIGEFQQNIFFRSKPLAAAVRDYFGKGDRKLIRDLGHEEIIDRLTEIVTFTKDGIDSVSIHVITVDKRLALRLTNLVAAATVKSLVEYEVQDLSDSDVYLKMQENQIQQSIKNTENEMAEFKKGKRLFSMNSAFDFSNSRSIELQREIAQIHGQISENNIEARRISRRQLEEGEVGNDDDYKFSLKRKLALITNSTEALRSKQKELEDSLKSLYVNVDENSEQRIFQLKGKLDLENGMYQELRKHAFQMQMRRITAENKFRLLDSARENNVKVSESLGAKLTIVFALSVLLSLLIGFMIEKAFPLVRSLADLQELGFLVLGSIPNGHTRKLRFLARAKVPKNSEEIFTPFMREEIGNAVLHIRARILRLTERAGVSLNRGKVVLVSSSEEGEGKSFSSQRLASALADARYKVLLIDADLRSPALTQRIGAKGKEGLTETLARREEFGKARISLECGVDFLPAGKVQENATKLLAGAEFEKLVRDFTALYDFVVIDSPPLCVASDAAIISRFSDIPILVVAYSKIYQEALNQSLDKVQSFYNGPIYAILNKTNQGRQYGYFLYGNRKKYYSSRRPNSPAA